MIRKERMKFMGKNSKQQAAEQAREFRRKMEEAEREKQRRQNRILLIISAVLVGIVLIAALIGVLLTRPKNTDTMKADAFEASAEATEYVKLTVSYVDKKGKEKQGDIYVQLRADVAPITVANFQKLVGEGFYNGLTFHRIVPGFMIQGGDPDGNGSGGSKETITGEFASNGVNNPIQHTRGVISMARSQSVNSASSQFFIVHDDSEQLDGSYAAFGRVVCGIKVVDGIAGTKTVFDSDENSTPVTPPRIVSATFVKVVG